AAEGVRADPADGGAVGEPVVFATNRLRLAVPAGNPADVTGLDDLARDELLVGLCAEGVPCGELARRVLADAGVTPAPDTEEPDVRALLAKIEAGELDAGLVYTTDVRAASGAVEGIDVPAGEAGTTRYPIATVAGAPHPDAAAAFVAFVASPAGRDVLAGHGFGPPWAGPRPAPAGGRPGPARRGRSCRSPPSPSGSSSCPWWRCCSGPRGPTSPSWCAARSSPTPCGSAWSRPPRPPACRCSAASPSPGSSPAPACPACRCSGPWPRCRSCCRRSSAVRRCCSPSAGGAWSASRSRTPPGSCCRSPSGG